MRRRTVIAYWLMPGEPAHSCFQQIVNGLARRYDAPVFEPHVTVHVGADHADAAKQAIAGAARECTPITLTPIGIHKSEEFVKTVFVQFAVSAKLRRLNEIIRNAAHDSSQYHLEPHLSLLYKKMETAARRELAASIELPLSEVTFVAIKAVRCISPTQSRADVEAWRVVAAGALSGDRV
ncbi:MAG TPA: 2'-5' RNA ligase family protein [Candidatus Acidoferrum sp.]|nr:2'-5' RNA ligase family protein [Candidatus Acidoferrum sp.]